MGETKKDGDWDFKVDSSDLAETNEVKKATKAGREKKVKRTATVSVNSDKVKQKSARSGKKSTGLGVDNSRKEKMTRSARARRDEENDRLAALQSPLISTRIKATVYDIVLIGVIVGATYFFKDDLNYYYVEQLAKYKINQTLHPDMLNRILVGGVSFVGILLFFIFPTIISRKSPGKKVEGIRVGSGDKALDASRTVIILRELILKPLSLVSVVGVVIGLKTKRNRGLHEMITGTTLYIDD
jgi:hypothetical protein